MKKSTQLIIALVVSGLIPGVPSAAPKLNDIRIVIDVSGSMKQSDPSNLRIPALKLLNGLIPDGSQAGVWTFGRYVDMAVRWSKVDDAWRKRADAGAEQIYASGLFTNIDRALARASQGWKKSDPDTGRTIILLTDGRVNISGNAVKNEASRQMVLTDRIESFKQNSVKVHTVALSKNADEAMLKRLALETGGSFQKAETAQQLQKLFFRIFERVTKPDSVKLDGNQFPVDNSISEMTLLVFRRPGSRPTRLYPPESSAITIEQPGNSAWRNDDGYDLITIKNPESGVWKFDADIDPDNRLMVKTDLKLRLDELPVYLMPLKPLEIGAQLYKKDRKISKNSILRFVDFSLTHKDSEGTEKTSKLVHTKERKKKGFYEYSFTQGLEEGSHSFVVSAHGRTFNRSKRVDIQVQWPVLVSIDPADEPGKYRLSVKAREEYLNPGSLIPTVQMEFPDGNREEIVMKQSRGAWVAILDTLQNGTYQALITIAARSVADSEVNLDLGKFPMAGVFREPGGKKAEAVTVVSEAADKITKDVEVIEDTIQPGWVFIAAVVGLVNLVLILAGLATWRLIRRANSAPELALDDGGANA